MKKFLFLASFLLIASSMFSQKDAARERNIRNFADDVNYVAKSKTTTDVKQERLMKLIGEMLADYKSVAAEKELDNILVQIDRADVAKQAHIKEAFTRIMASEAKNVRQGHNPKPIRDFTKLCGPKDDACIIAAKLYSEIGFKNVAGEKPCKGNCDFDQTRDPKSRGAGDDQWVYTGTRKFFNEKDMFGWRYLCRLEKSNTGMSTTIGDEPARSRDNIQADPVDGLRNGGGEDDTPDRPMPEAEDDGAEFSDDANYGPASDTELAWKRDINVDRW